MQRMMEEETLKSLGGKSGGWGETDARALVISNFSKTTACRHELAQWEVHLGNKMT